MNNHAQHVVINPLICRNHKEAAAKKFYWWRRNLTPDCVQNGNCVQDYSMCYGLTSWCKLDYYDRKLGLSVNEDCIHRCVWLFLSDLLCRSNTGLDCLMFAIHSLNAVGDIFKIRTHSTGDKTPAKILVVQYRSWFWIVCELLFHCLCLHWIMEYNYIYIDSIKQNTTLTCVIVE